MLSFLYSTVNAGKTAHLIMRAHSCSEAGINHEVLVPEIASKRDGVSRVSSRIGIQRGASSLKGDTCPYEYIISCNERALRVWGKPNPIKIVFVDEAQFLTKAQVVGLTRIVDELAVPVFAYGLRTDFKGELFEGSSYLLGWADKVEEISIFGKSEYGGLVERATFNMKVDLEGKQVVKGDSIDPGFGYLPVSRKRFGLTKF